MDTILTLADLKLPGFIEYKDGQDYEASTFGDLPVYNPDKPNQYFERASPSGEPQFMFDRAAGKIVPYSYPIGEMVNINIPGGVPFGPPSNKVTINGKLNEDQWNLASFEQATELAGAVNLEMGTYKEAFPSAAVTGTSFVGDWYFVKFKNYFLNVGQAWKTRQPYGLSTPGNWKLDPINATIKWEPDTRVNPVTLPVPIRNLKEDEELSFPPFGDPVIVKKAAPPAGDSSEDVKKLLEGQERIEALLSQVLLKVSLL